MDGIDQLKEDIQEVGGKITKILSLLQGNDLDKDDKGLVGTVNDIDKRVKTLEKWKDRIVWLLIGLSIPAGVGFSQFFAWVGTFVK
jgi:hypothetical protein